jgi:hypothetical protein
LQVLPIVPWPVALVQLICCGVELSTTVPNAVPTNSISNASPVADPTVIVTLGIVVPASVALIVVVIPAPTALTSPLALIVAAAGLEELHAALFVKS